MSESTLVRLQRLWSLSRPGGRLKNFERRQPRQPNSNRPGRDSPVTIGCHFVSPGAFLIARGPPAIPE